jgi:tripartite ATP-independent transporter DctP family solute receptor
MLSQLRSGGIDFFANSGLILSSLVPVAAINGIGFAFPDYPSVWRAMDGALGKHVMGAIEKAGLVPFEKMWDNGYRQTLSATKPIRTADDLKGFKIRVPPSPLWTGLFKDLGASPVSIPWGETYTAMQTKVADGLENPLAGIYFAKMHEVGKFISTTNHMWDGFWFVANRRSFESLPPSAREIVRTAVNAAAMKQREADAKQREEALTSPEGRLAFVEDYEARQARFQELKDMDKPGKDATPLQQAEYTEIKKEKNDLGRSLYRDSAEYKKAVPIAQQLREQRRVGVTVVDGPEGVEALLASSVPDDQVDRFVAQSQRSLEAGCLNGRRLPIDEGVTAEAQNQARLPDATLAQEHDFV